MSSKKPPSKPRPKFSFAVDRDEIGITSEWADTFIPAPPAAPVVATGIERATEEKTSSDENNATVAAKPVPAIIPEVAAVGETATGEAVAPVDENATVVDNAPRRVVAVDRATEVQKATVANDATVVKLANPSAAAVASRATGPENAAVVHSATPSETPRRSRAKPLRSVADGLTPGQFIVYTQMYAKGEGQGTRFYRGGYHSLCALTGLSKRGLQNVIGELQAKNVVSIETAPGHNPTQVSVYRVRQEADVLQQWYAAGLRFVMGKGKILLSQAV